MTTDAMRPPEKRYGYSNVFHGLVNLVKAEGIRGLCRGIGANTVPLNSCVQPLTNIEIFLRLCSQEQC